jgi:xanthine dehydrogenase iron-sulfur cluster and FAD-binding subunit A
MRCDAVAGNVSQGAVNACLRPLASMDGCSVLTPEGMGSRSLGYHPIQIALAANNGSQCGFCSPGWTMQVRGGGEHVPVHTHHAPLSPTYLSHSATTSTHNNPHPGCGLHTPRR